MIGYQVFFQDAALLLLREVAEHLAEKSPLRSAGKEAEFPVIDKWGPVMSADIKPLCGFTRYFYRRKPWRDLEENRADILVLERETEGLLGKVFGGAQ